MKIISKYFFIQLVFLISSSFYAQVGINTTEPDNSAILDVFSSSKGLLMPRLSTEQRNAISSPAPGLMIYNTTVNDGELNMGTALAPIWVGIKGELEPTINSVTETGGTSTSSTEYSLVSDMELNPTAGSYMVLFNAQLASEETFSSDAGVLHLFDLYNALQAVAATSTGHAAAFGSETLLPGVYETAAAMSISGTLTLDGNNEDNPIFIVRFPGAFTTAVNATVTLTNGATANNVFWIAGGAISTAAGATIRGTMIAKDAAIGLGANTIVDGSLLSTSGAITMGATCVITSQADSSYNFGVLGSFGVFTSAGGISSCADCHVYGDAGTGFGAITTFPAASYVGYKLYPAGTESSDSGFTSYSIFKDEVEVPYSLRTLVGINGVVNLQANVSFLTTPAVGETPNSIKIKWKVDVGKAKLVNRTLSLIRSHY
jgi:hypothetical protein